jgi:hypothetical protein
MWIAPNGGYFLCGVEIFTNLRQLLKWGKTVATGLSANKPDSSTARQFV